MAPEDPNCRLGDLRVAVTLEPRVERVATVLGLGRIDLRVAQAIERPAQHDLGPGWCMLGKRVRNVVPRRLADRNDSEGARHDALL